MAIIKTQFLGDDGSGDFKNRIPSYCPERYPSFADGTYIICSGSGGGEEISKAELLTFVQTVHDAVPYTVSSGTNPNVTSRSMTDAEVVTMVNDWCTERGIS